MNAILLAAGKSTRTYPLTLTRPKPLLPIANEPILVHQLRALQGIVDEVVIVVGFLHEMIRERFGDEFEGLRIRYVLQEEQRGTGHALLQCADHVDGSFLVMNGDDLFEKSDLERLAQQKNAALAKWIEDPRSFGVFDVEDDLRITGVTEKPTALKPRLANIGAYAFSSDIFDILRNIQPSSRGEIELTSAMQVVADNGDLYAVKAEGHWLPIGYPWDLLNANEVLMQNVEHSIEGQVSPLADLSGPISIAEGAVVKAGAVIEGPVIIAKGAVVGPNCWIRPGTVIGAGCKVGQGVEIKNSILMDGARVPHLSYMGDSVIGQDANMGCGTITANFRHDGKNHSSMVKGELIDTGRRKLGAIVGDDVHTGINTSLYPGRKLWPHTSTLPGEVVQRDKEE